MYVYKTESTYTSLLFGFVWICYLYFEEWNLMNEKYLLNYTYKLGFNELKIDNDA